MNNALSTQRIAALMRAARKRNSLTQIEVSKRLDISQSALSKMESGILVPSAPQWFDFCQITGISSDSISIGYIEELTNAVLQPAGLDIQYKLPKVYRENRGSKVRAMLPFIEYFRSIVGMKKAQEYFRSMKIDDDLFVDLDLQISLQFCLDFAHMMISRGYFKSTDFLALTRDVSESRTHGELHRLYDGQTNSLQMLRTLLSNSRRYECNFNYEIEDKKSDVLVMSVRPESHLKDLGYRNDPVLNDFLCQYKRHYFERFTQYGGNRRAQLREVECHYHGSDRCIYELKMVG